MSKPLIVRSLAIAGLAMVMILGLTYALGQDDDGEPPPPATSTEPRSGSTSAPRPSSTGTSTTSASTTTQLSPSTEVPTGPAIPIRRGPAGERLVALTFDAGSDTGSTATILDRLAANGILATFGLTGRWAEANPALVRRMVSEGHQLVNHSYDHPSFTGRSTGEDPLPRDARLDQLARAEAAIRAAGGSATAPWFRPPYGDEDQSVRADVALAGYRYELLWTVDSLGWKGLAPTSVVDRCLDGAEPGTIYLFHVGAASTDAAALQPIIDGLRALGYGFATADRLLASG